MKLTNLMTVNPMPNLIAVIQKTVVDPAIVQKLQRINLENVSVSGVDLGIRNLAATITRTWDNSEIHESNVLHKSKDFHFRLKICAKICKPNRDSMPAHRVYTNTPKRSIKRKMEIWNLGTKPTQDERRTRVPMNPKDRWTDLDVLRIEKRHSLKATLYKRQPLNA
ncbi:hypothetical protein Bhyg_13185, partial [Pseudolycoriella hygida]